MVHTTKDYSGLYKQERVYGNIDNAEISARNNLNNMFDRRGNVVWFDDFEHAGAIKWNQAILTTGTIALTTARSWMGNQSLLLTTTAVVNNYCYIAKTFSLPANHTLGAEIMFFIESGKPDILMNFYGYNGTNVLASAFLYDYNADTLSYYNGAGGWTTLTVVDSSDFTEEHWIPMKMVVDWTNGYYVRLLFAGTEYAIPTQAINTTPNVTPQRISARITVRANTAAVCKVYLDNFILTQNE